MTDPCPRYGRTRRVPRVRRVRRVRRSSLVWAGAIVLVAAVLAVLAFVPLLRGGGSGTEGSLVGKQAPSIAADDLSGRRWTLADGRGRLVWINFWATSCVPCRTEMPAMQRLAEAYGDRLLILGLDWGEERSSVADFVQRYAIGYPILLDPTLTNFYRWAQGSGLPRHYLVDGSGRVVREVVGSLDPARMAAILSQLLGPPRA
jgi:thiol-disulfide isomerase/thioredoxin